jgi:hypothetical protein
VNARVQTLAVYDDGSGSALYAGGDFSFAGGAPADNIAKWDGASWTNLASGVSGSGSTRVYALAVYDDGGGSALYAAGDFILAGGAPANNIAKWDGSTWTALGSGVNNSVFARAVHNDGSGPALYAGGLFGNAGGASALRIAKWDGSAWSSLGSGLNQIPNALTAFDDGSGPALYAAGAFTMAGGVAARFAAKWDGSSWVALGSGMSSGVFALTVHDDGFGPALYAGGSFVSAFDSEDSYIAKWGGCSPPNPPTTYCTGKTTSAACVPFLSHSGTPSATAGPFTIFSNDHLEGQVGVYLYSFQKENLDFHGGKLCVKAPIQRLSTLIKTADGIACASCAGNCRMFKRNFNELIQSGSDPLLTPGQNVKVQAQQRDPLDPFSDNLSNGIAFVIEP